MSTINIQEVDVLHKSTLRAYSPLFHLFDVDLCRPDFIPVQSVLPEETACLIANVAFRGVPLIGFLKAVLDCLLHQ